MQELIYKLRWLLFVVAVIVTCVIWYAVIHEERNNILTVAFLDIGQGDSIFIDSPSGTQVLIDGGRNSKVLRELAKVMPFYDRSIDMVIATHPDADHIGGLIDVLSRYKVDTILRPGVQSETPASESLLKLLADKDTQELFARRGQVFDLGDGAYLRILFPDRDASGFEPNTASIVAQLVYGEHKFLLTGDSPIKIENYLVKLEGKNLHSDVLKLGHHGSRTSSGDLFLGFVAPDYAIISAGKNNKYGHPHKEVLEKLKQFEIPTLSTINRGTIIFKSDGSYLRLVH